MANKVISSFDIGAGDNYTLSVPYGKCSTAANVAAKTVSVGGQFALEAGAIVAVRFAVTNSATTNPTLNVNGTGAKAIYYQGAPITPAYLKANYTYQFIYNGGQWDLIGEIDTKNSGTVVAVVAGNGLTGGGPNGTVTVDVGAGNGITVSANAVSAKAGTGITVDSTGINAKPGTGITVDNDGINNSGVRSITQDSTDGHKLIIDTGGASTTITIPDNDTGTTYSAGTGLSLSGTTFNHSNSVTAGTAAGSANNTELTYGGSFTVPTITYDAQGHITAKGTRTMRMPAKVTAADLGLSAVMKFLGTSATAITDGATTNPITIGTTSTTVTSGNVVLYSGKEFVWTGSAWEELGNEGSHALKTITISAGSGLTGGGTLEANRTISHADTSTQASITANGRKYITGVTLDTYGHVTGLTTGTETVTDTNTTYTIATGDSNGQIKVTPSSGNAYNVSVKGLGEAAYKNVDTSISAASTSTNLPTSKAVAAFVEGKGYKTTDNNTTYTFATGSTNGTFTVTPSGGTAQSVAIKGLGSLAYSSATIPTVNNGTLTIQRNGTNVATFSANQSGNATANITDNDTLNTAGSSNNTGKLFIVGAGSQNATGVTTYSNSGVYMQNGSLTASTVYGAVWNDYAEYREGTDTFEPGRVICENGDDTLSLATERLQPGASIVSDTFGFAIGETDECKTPVAVSGRVLVYPYEDRESYKPGDAVCAAPNGTVSKMTREEIREYPERIIGTVSAIPSYETWGTGNVKVNGRIWVKVR